MTPISILKDYYSVNEILNIKLRESSVYWGETAIREIANVMKYPQREPFPSRYFIDYTWQYHMDAAYKSAKIAFHNASILVK